MFKILKTTCATIVALSAFGGVPVRKEVEIPSGRPIDAPLLFESIEEPDRQYLKLFALKDTPIFTVPTLTSSVVKTLPIGSTVYVYNELRSNHGSYYITDEGYIKHEDLTYLEEYVFYPVSETFYATDGAIALDLPSAEDGVVVEAFALNDPIKVDGCNNFGYYRLAAPHWGFIEEQYLMPHPYVPPVVASSGNTTITARGGVYYYNGRKETYYSSRVLYHYKTPEWSLDSEGFYHDANGYYVVAANDMSFGTVFDCSKGACIVLDCGCAPGVTDYYCNW